MKNRGEEPPEDCGDDGREAETTFVDDDRDEETNELEWDDTTFDYPDDNMRENLDEMREADRDLSPFSTRRICSRDAKRKQEFSNVIGCRSSELFRQPITLLNSCFRFASREQIRLVENGL